VVNLAILSKTSSLIQKVKKQKVREGKMYLKGALDSAHFHRMRKEPILLLHKQEKHLANIVIKLSNISKHSKLMLTELRYQVKIHTISNRPRDKKKILQILPFFKKKKRKRKQTKQSKHAIWK